MQFAAQGFLPVAMVNYLALLGWNDGTEDEIFSVQDLGKTSFRIMETCAVSLSAGKLDFGSCMRVSSTGSNG